ncbi:MAG: hypothetical protein JW716_00850 [Candidatus Aenigmarchaeota archaeon]|nr:hypothetical protein [Candidatus Aenigmarchaeota archaeon]
MGLFSNKGEIEELKLKMPIKAEFVALVSNTLNEDFEEELLEGNYIMISKSKVIAITNPEVIIHRDPNQVEVQKENLEVRGENLVGLGESWINKEILGKLIEAFVLYEKNYRMFINPRTPFPLLITTYDGNVSIAPVVA